MIKMFRSPLIMSILVTNRCPLKCKHCFYHETIDNSNLAARELSLEEYEQISKSMGTFMTAIFCGGEPFVRDDFYEIVGVFQRNNKILLSDSASNGQFTERILNQVELILSKAKYQKYSLGISLDGFKETHNSIRGAGAFERAMMTWKELKRLEHIYDNFELYICSTINVLNEIEMNDFIIWVSDELRPSKISLLKIRQNPRDGEYLKGIDIKNYKKCINTISDLISQGKMGDPRLPKTHILEKAYQINYQTMLLGERQFNCKAGSIGGFIDYDGSVGVCEILPCIGNIREYGYDFKKLWNSKDADSIRNQVCRNTECSQCTHESEGLLPSLIESL